MAKRTLFAFLFFLEFVSEYRGAKLSTNPIVFLVGVTVLVLAALSIVNPSLRRRYGYFFFACCFILGFHAIPAALLNPIPWKNVLYL